MTKRFLQLTAVLATAAFALSLSGCGLPRKLSGGSAETAAPVVENTIQEEAPTEEPEKKETEKKLPLITSVDYTSRDNSVRITLPDNTWAVTNDVDEMRVFQSGEDAYITIVHADGENAVNTLMVQKSKDALEESLTSQYASSDAFSVESFEAETVGDVELYRYVVKYNSTARMWAYSVTSCIISSDQGYTVTGTVKDDNKILLKAVEDSVDSFTVLSNDTLKTAIDAHVNGTTAPTETKSAASAVEKTGLKEYGTTATLYANDDVNIRLAPGTDSDIIGSLSKGQSVTVTGETSGWFQVNIAGNTGYIRKDFLVNRQAETTASTDAQQAETAGAQEQAELNTALPYDSPSTLYASSGVNIRSGPSTDSAVLGSLDTGNSVTVIGETDNWFVVSTGAGQGYVSKAYLTSGSQAETTAPETSAGSGDSGNASQNTGSDGGSSGSGSSGSQSASSLSQVAGVITSTTSDSITISGDDGNNYTIYTGDAATSSVDGIYDGVYVAVTLDSSKAKADGTLYATGVTGY